MSAPFAAPARTFNLAGFTRALIMALIEGQRDPSTKKEWIMVAYADGHLTAAEAEDWIVLNGLQAA